MNRIGVFTFEPKINRIWPSCTFKINKLCISRIVNQQRVVYNFQCPLCDARYLGKLVGSSTSTYNNGDNCSAFAKILQSLKVFAIASSILLYTIQVI